MAYKLEHCLEQDSAMALSIGCHQELMMEPALRLGKRLNDGAGAELDR
jgi:hypothetical protein